MQEGAYLNDQDEEGNTALMRASVHGHTEVVDALVGAGADLYCVEHAQLR